jgi:hypothetical protein
MIPRKSRRDHIARLIQFIMKQRVFTQPGP